MIGEVVSQSAGTAQVFFLVALICGAVAAVMALIQGNLELCVAMACVTFASVGLLFFA